MYPTNARALRTLLAPIHALVLSACGDDGRESTHMDALAGDAAAPAVASEHCAPPLERCAGECVDTAVSADHCGGCGAACTDGLACVAGECTAGCSADLLACGARCVDAETDPAHCGGCDVACGRGERCVQGDCEGCDTEPLTAPLPITVEVDTRDHADWLAGSCAQGDAPEARYRFTAPRAGRYAFSTAGSRFNTVLYVLSEPCGGDELACSDDRGGGLASMVELELARDQEVTVVVDGFEGQAGQARLEIRELAQSTCCTARAEPGCGLAAPEACVCALDDFCCMHAWDDACVALAASADCDACGHAGGECRAAAEGNAAPEALLAAIEEVDAVTPSCGSGPAPEALFAFTAPHAGLYAFDTGASAVADTVLAVLEGTTCAGAELACVDDVGDELFARATLRLQAGQQVLLAVESWDLERGEVELAVREAESLSDVCDAEPLDAALPLSATGEANAGPGRLEPSCALFGSAGETLFAFTAPAAGRYRLDTAGSAADTIVQVLDGDCTGAELACNDDPSESSLAAAVEVDLLAGQTVIVNVDSVDGYGAFELSIEALP